MAHSNDTQTSSTQTVNETAEIPAVTVVAEPVRASVVEITPEAAGELRRQFDETNTGGNRFGWFLLGFLAALIAGLVAAAVFLVVSDSDDSGNLQIDVPAVDVDIEN